MTRYNSDFMNILNLINDILIWLTLFFQKYRPSLKNGSADCDSIYIIYPSLCTQTADLNHFDLHLFVRFYQTIKKLFQVLIITFNCHNHGCFQTFPFCIKNPNCFWLLGPGSVLGHNTVLYMIECQVGEDTLFFFGWSNH